MSRMIASARGSLAGVGVVALAVLGSGCVSDEGASDGAGSPDSTPVRGGEVVYGLEAETSGGWCLPESTLAISGIMVARAIYDTLTTPDEDGEFVPLLAESVEPNDDFTDWTITLRDGVVFHDGSELTAEVVKNNVDAWLGRYDGRASLLFPFVFQSIDTVEVVDPLTVRVTTDAPWPALPAYLYGGGRTGIMAQAQLDDPETCDAKLIGTGPFELEEWVIGDHLSATRNESYWASDADGDPLPYLDRIEFRPIVDSQTRVNSLLSGELDMMHASGAEAVEVLEDEHDAGAIGLVQSTVNTEVGHLMLNASRAPFDSATARNAVAHAYDRELYREVRLRGLFQIANGPFPPGSPGYLEDTGFPEHDPEEARRLAQQYERETGEPLEFNYVYSGDNGGTLTAQFVQEQMAAAGIDVKLRLVEQATLIGTALGGDWDAIPYRNFPAGSPDGNYLWWYGGSPVNFNKFDDPEINELMDAGRVEPDREVARSTYEDVNREFGAEVYNIWLEWTEWNIASGDGVGGVLGPQLPDGSQPTGAVATGHSVAGLWNAG